MLLTGWDEGSGWRNRDVAEVVDEAGEQLAERVTVGLGPAAEGVAQVRFEHLGDALARRRGRRA